MKTKQSGQLSVDRRYFLKRAILLAPAAGMFYHLLSGPGAPAHAVDAVCAGAPDKIHKTEDQWEKILTPDQFDVLRKKGTERPFTGGLLKNRQKGIYACAACGLPLFSSKAKFDSGTGWPSFFQPVCPRNVLEESDTSWFMVRTEVLCARCGGHLGHVFKDGPPPTGLRYCINSVSLKFETGPVSN